MAVFELSDRLSDAGCNNDLSWLFGFVDDGYCLVPLMSKGSGKVCAVGQGSDRMGTAAMWGIIS